MTLEEKARYSARLIIDWCCSDETERERMDANFPSHEIERCMKAQHCADIEKLKDVMNRLMLDTRDKAEIIKAMEG